MAVLGGDVVKIQVTTTSSTASFRDISQQVLEFSGFAFEAVLQESHAFGDAWREHLYTNFRQIGEITLGGFYDDDTSTGVRGIFGAATDVGAERVMKLGLGTTNAYPKFDFLVRSFQAQPRRGELTGFQVVLAPTGSFAIVTT